MQQIFSRLGLFFIVASGLATGMAGRLMWQPGVVKGPSGGTQTTIEDRGIETGPKSSNSAVAAPRGMDLDVWHLLQERPQRGGWAATVERLRAEGRDDLCELVMLRWCEADGISALSWLVDQSPDQWPGGGAVHQWISNHPAVAWKVALTKCSLVLARIAVYSPSALAADPPLLREILDSSASTLRTVPSYLAEQFARASYLLPARADAFLTLAVADRTTAARLLGLMDPRAPGAYEMWKAWLDLDPAAAGAMLNQVSERKQVMWKAQLAGHLARTDPKAVEKMWDDLPVGMTKDAVARELLFRRAEIDPLRALADAQNLDATVKAYIESAVIRKLAATDPAAALAQAEKAAASRTAGISLRLVDSPVLEALAGVDWNRAFAIAVRVNGAPAASMLNSKDPAQVAQGLAILREFGAEDATAATRALTILNVANKQQEIRALAEGAADSPLTAAARIWLASESVGGQGGPRPVRSTPDAAMAQILSDLDPSLVPSRVFSDAAAWWVRQEPEQASHWVAGLPAGAARDAAIGGLVDALIGEPQLFNGWFSSPNTNLQSQSSAEQSDYPSALAWATTAGDPTIREDLTLRITRRWIDNDPIGAVDGIRVANVSAEKMQWLLNELGIAP